ncbi:MAG: hypothetical protein PVSMB7_23320 [Chloroflexota bacterium]
MKTQSLPAMGMPCHVKRLLLCERKRLMLAKTQSPAFAETQFLVNTQSLAKTQCWGMRGAGAPGARARRGRATWMSPRRAM